MGQFYRVHASSRVGAVSKTHIYMRVSRMLSVPWVLSTWSIAVLPYREYLR